MVREQYMGRILLKVHTLLNYIKIFYEFYGGPWIIHELITCITHDNSTLERFL